MSGGHYVSLIEASRAGSNQTASPQVLPRQGLRAETRPANDIGSSQQRPYEPAETAGTVPSAEAHRKIAPFLSKPRTQQGSRSNVPGEAKQREWAATKPVRIQRRRQVSASLQKREFQSSTRVLNREPERSLFVMGIRIELAHRRKDGLFVDESHVAGTRGTGMESIVQAWPGPKRCEDPVARDLMISPGPRQQGDEATYGDQRCRFDSFCS